MHKNILLLALKPFGMAVFSHLTVLNLHLEFTHIRNTHMCRINSEMQIESHEGAPQINLKKAKTHY